MVEPSKSDQAKRVVYLFGAGASHACVKAVGSNQGILMRDLNEDLAEEVRKLVASEDEYNGDRDLLALVNEVVDENSDYEHIITFLDQSVSAKHRAFAEDLRTVFERVLRHKLGSIEDELGESPIGLYEALLDMYEVPDFKKEFKEELGGVLTINYDDYIEQAVASFSKTVDFGVRIQSRSSGPDSMRVLKLHGSFGWQHAWPISPVSDGTPLWIPPGIQKAKDQYPFNVLWGLAREMLDCDVLRIVGCKLGSNDWDLISLLFSTRLVNAEGRQYAVEVIDAPLHAKQLRETFPYLGIRSILEVEPIGSQMVSEFSDDGKPRKFEELSEPEQEKVLKRAGWSKNWFYLWLKQMAEAIYTELGSVQTELGKFESLLEAY